MTRIALHGVIAELGDDECRVLHAIALRLLGGQKTYGRLDIARDARDWSKELNEEILDVAVYTAIYLLKENDKK